MKWKGFFSKNKKCAEIQKEARVKVTGTRTSMDIEYQDNIIQFIGELCENGFYAITESGEWIRHDSLITQQEIIRIVEEENCNNKEFKIFFE